LLGGELQSGVRLHALHDSAGEAAGSPRYTVVWT
jgi:hypothetical protein